MMVWISGHLCDFLTVEGGLTDEIVLAGRNILCACSDGTIFEAGIVDGRWTPEIKRQGVNLINVEKNPYHEDMAYVIQFSGLEWVYVCSIDVVVEEYSEDI